jgi:chaperone required for assembly of F1-ATPase
MSNWVAKRFWTDVNVIEIDGGFAVHLDARPVKTPAKAALVVPTRSMADAVAGEWRLVVEKIDPNVMPVTRSANASIDKVATQFGEVATMLAAYGGSDLLCYRAENPEGLVQRQTEGWDPLLDWAHATFGARLVSTVGIMPIEQSEVDLAALSAPLFEASNFELAAFHDLIAMSGSLVIALGVTRRHLTPAEAWTLSRIDETWQAEQWGTDDDAAQVAEIKRAAFVHAADFYQMASIHARG